MANMTADQAEALVTKIEAGGALSAAEMEQLKSTIRAMAAAIVVQDAQIGELGLTIGILKSEQDAARASRAAALNSLRIISPPAASINVDDAVKQAADLRKKVAESESFAKMAIAATRFAVGVAMKFV